MRVHTDLRLILTLGALACLVVSVPGQAMFDSGSDGLDGPLTVAANTTLPVQEDGIHNYTTIVIGATLRFSPNSRNTPVILLAQGDVSINGSINIDGANGRNSTDPLAAAPGNEAVPGPGGFPGGLGAVSVFMLGNGIGTSGGGPGGGAAADDPSPGGDGRGRAGNGASHITQGAVGSDNFNPAGPTYGDPSLITLSGGSGGGGGNMVATQTTSVVGPAGGGGGGGILIASSGTITINGSIFARGGTGGAGNSQAGAGAQGSGGGAGGAIRLMANQIGGTGQLRATGGAAGGSGGIGGLGVIRLESFSFTGLTNTDPPALRSLPTVLRLPDVDIPTITIATINGTPVPDPPTGSTATPDVLIPMGTPNPIAIGIETTNVPQGSVINLRLTPSNGDLIEVTSTPVDSQGDATASVTLPVGVGVIYATADFP